MDTDVRVEQGVRFFQTNYEARKVSLARATITDRGKRTERFNEGQARLTLRPSGMGLEGHIRSMIKKSDDGVEVFYSPTPFSGSKGRKKEQALPNIVVYGDADQGLTADVKARLTELGACLVLSGGITPDNGPKYHVYLLLTREVPPAELERLNRGLKAFIRGDKFDATTLLRVPGTRNHKYPGSPIVKVERYADARHKPENLAKFLGTPADDTSSTSTSDGVELPEEPKGFRFTATKPGYAHVRRYVREWNGKWNDPNQDVRRYMAAIVIVKEAIKRQLTMDEAYAFALRCEPLVDKQEEENGYSIQKDVAKIWRRETGIKPSGTLTADDILSAHQTEDARNKTSTTPSEPVSPPPPSFTPAGMPDLGPSFPFQTPNLDELLSGDYKPLEPTLVPCGPFHLLYPGKSHGISSDRGVGKTQTTIAMVYEVMKRGGRVAYFDFEDSPDTFIRDRMMNQFGIPEAMIRGQFLYFHGTTAFDDLNDHLTLTEGIKQLAEAIKDWDLVVVDGVTASMSDWSVEDDKTKPNNSLDGGKATDYTWWYDRQVKPFLKVGLATLQIDHVNKTGGNRVSGTGQKGAKFTGVEYELRAEKNGSLVMGGTGKLLLSVAKDRVGRIARYKKKRPENDDDALDVARFVMTSDMDGHVTRAMFEPVNQGTDAQTPSSSPSRGPVLDEKEHKALHIIRDSSTPLNKGKFRQLMGVSNTAAVALVKSLQSKGLVDVVDGGRGAQHIVPVANAPQVETLGQAELDFTQADRKPKGAKRKLECHRCRDLHEYPEQFIQADEIGYQPGRRLCRSCAGESIESESYQEPRDGAEWAREIREKRDRRQSTHGEDDLS